MNQEILDLRPNAEALPNLAAVLFNNNQCKIIDITNGSTECEIPLTDVSAICWSPKGKQIVCGKLDGSLEHYDTKGERKASLNIPQAMSAGHEEEEKNRYVQDVLWIENHIFLVLYARPRANEDDEYVNDGFVINRKPASGSNEPQYIRLAEVTPIFTTEGRGNHFYMEVIRHLGQEIKHLVIIGNAATNELSVVGQLQEGEWATWMLPENGVASLPLSDEGSMDTYPLGLALDFTADEKLPPVDASENDVGVDPMPVFYYLNDEGVIGAYHCYNTEIGRKGESYNAMSSFLSSATTAPTTTTSTASVTQTPAPPATVSGFSAFGSVTTGSSSSFGDLLSGKSTSPPAATATSGFGSFGAPPASGTGGFSFSNLASTQKIPATPSAGFGALAASNKSTTAAPLFGSTTNIGFGSSTTFGASTSSSVDKPLSSFGSASATKTEEHVVPETKTATDSSSSTTLSLFGGMKLGQSTSPAAAEVPKSPFGGFGGFGSSSSTTKLATTTTTTTSAFGSTDIKAAPTSAFGSTSALGSTGGFGSFGSATATTTETKATPPATTTSAFGSTDTKAAFTSSFGSTSSLGSGGFGSLAKNTIPGATAPTFGSSSTLGGGFGSLAKNTVPGATAPSSTPLFGSGSGFGSLATTTKKTDENEAKSTTPAAAGKKSPFTVPSTASTTATAAAAATTTGSGIGLGISSTSKPTETKPATSSPTPIKSPASTPTPASPAATAATTTVDKDKAKATTAPSSTPAAAQKEKLKPTAAEGMAREYESLYITVCEGIDDLKTIHERIDIIMAANTDSTPKTEASIKDKSSEWNLNDVATFAKLTESIVANIQKGQASAAQIKEQLETLSINSKKCKFFLSTVKHARKKNLFIDVMPVIAMDKKEDIRYLLQKEIDVEVVDLMDNRELDPETKTTLNHIENKSEASEHTLSDLEFKVQEYKKRNKIKNDHHSG